MSKYSVVGQRVPRVRARELVTGEARFSTDIKLPGMLYGRVLRSPYPHARILNIDTTLAERLPGVKAVVTARDMPKWAEVFPPMAEAPLARERVRFVGEAVAGVAAINEDVAAKALHLIKVEYEELPAVFDVEEAMQPDAPIIHQAEHNIAARFEIIRGDVEKGFREADFIVEDRFVTPPQNHCCMETKTCVASFDTSGKLTFWSTATSVFAVRGSLARAMSMPENKIRLIQPAVGGHFGRGTSTPQSFYICTLLARKTGLPVRIQDTREEEFIAGKPQLPVIIELKMGVKRDGTITAKETRITGDTGAYYSPVVLAVLTVAAIRHEALYRLSNVRTEAILAHTNRVPTGPLRGFGNPQGHFALESMMDMLAEKLAMDPAELRLKNAIRTGDTNVHGWVMRNCNLSECIEKSTESAGWQEKRKSKQPKRGTGLACAIHIAGNKKAGDSLGSGAFVKVNDDGTVNLLTGQGEGGQGAATVLSQICAEELGVLMEDVSISAADTDISPYCPGPYSSRVTVEVGNAVRLAAADARQQLFRAAAEKLEVDTEALEARERKIYVRGHPEKAVSIAEAAMTASYRPILGKGTFFPPQEGSNPKTLYGDCGNSYSFAADVAEVAVDTETGEVKVLSITTTQDMGTAINPQSTEGQIEGGIVQGIGYALMEILEPTKGKVVKSQLTDYKITTAADVPVIKSILLESTDPGGPFGAKGVGEIAMVSTAAAIANAIYDAVGVRVKELPITPEKVLQALKEKEAKGKA